MSRTASRARQTPYDNCIVAEICLLYFSQPLIYLMLNQIPQLDDFAVQHPRYAYRVDSAQFFGTKAEVMRQFYLKHRDYYPCGYATSEGGGSSIEVYAATGERSRITLFIEPSSHAEMEGLREVYEETLELRPDLEARRQWNEETRENTYPILRRRSLQHKKVLLDTFLTEFRERRISTEETEEALRVVATTGVGEFESRQTLILNYHPDDPSEPEALREAVATFEQRHATNTNIDY
ncbi:hypothetical protein [Hymenobacter jejuensis]|uniref:Uncharacterized protein n=1 Tax=Hymenobacter jejuensis TaxID=2502781 RepID=A0A5B7ZVA1_9BACT|nr:hypothetical protein [Hymenobacter jejuensis]QDA59011.1 hypothetical protein FHG12_02345 [Hymenobacter jejuensis]